MDGGGFLHSAKWQPNITYGDVINLYKNYLMAAFGLCIAVFDGYDNAPSTKDHKHQVEGAKLSQNATVDLRRKVKTFLEMVRTRTVLSH